MYDVNKIRIKLKKKKKRNTTMFSIIEEAKETILDFSQGTVKVL